VTANGEERRGIASERQRREAERLLKTDPHFAALFAEVSGTLRRAAALLPLPLLPSDGSAASLVLDGASAVRDRIADIVETIRQHAISAYVRAADPTLLASPRPGTVVAAFASCVAVGGGAFGAYDAVSQQPADRPAPVARASQPPVDPIASSAVPSTATFRVIKRTARRHSQAAIDSPAQAPPTAAPVTSTAPPPPASPQPIQPNPQPAPPPSEFGFEQ
jgi:hypothetical protein